MMTNIPLLTKVMEFIEAHPGQHDQGGWATQTLCGTTACFAGHTVVMAGWNLIFNKTDDLGQPYATTCTNPDTGRVHMIEEVAAQELSIDDYWSGKLFYAGDTITDLRRIVNEIVARS